jgi:hypothetical protein
MAQRRMTTCGIAVANGEQRAVGAAGGGAPCGLAREPTDVVHMSQLAWCKDPWTCTGLTCAYDEVRQRVDVAPTMRRGRRHACGRG